MRQFLLAILVIAILLSACAPDSDDNNKGGLDSFNNATAQAQDSHRSAVATAEANRAWCNKHPEASDEQCGVKVK